jgi:hypothetical protein
VSLCQPVDAPLRTTARKGEKMSKQFLIERFTPSEAQLKESFDAQKNLYLSGRMMAG